MHRHLIRPNLVLVFACSLAFLFFIFGITVPMGHFWGGFLLPILAVFLWGSRDTWRRDIYIVTALASVLVVITFWGNGAAIFDGMLVSHLLSLAIIWAAAWLLAQRRQLVDREQGLAAEVAARTAELQASEQRYRLLAENAGDIIWTVDMDGNLTYVSPSAQRVRGVSREEEQSASWFDRMPPKTAAGAAAAIQADLAALRAGQSIDATPHLAPAYRKDGTLMWSETVLSPLCDNDGKPLGLCGTTRDITARHEAEEALRRSEERFAKLFEAAPTGIVLARQSDLGILDANEAFAKLTGFTRGELTGHTGVELGILSAEARSVMIDALKEEGWASSLELEMCCKCGAPIDVVYSMEPIDIGGEDCFLTSVIDISKRKAAERERLFLSALVNSSPDAIIGRTLAGAILSWNHGAELLFGYTTEEAIGQNVTMLAAPGNLARMQAEMAEIARGTALEGFETQRMAKDGRIFDCRISVFPVRDDAGETIGVASFTHDISERKRLEHAAYASEARLRAVIENTEDSIWSVDHDYCFLVGNAAFARGVQQQIGRPPVVGECVLDEPFPPSARAFWEPLYDRALDGESFMFEIPSSFQRPGGTLAIYLNPIYAIDGTIAGVSCRGADITALKQVEAQLREAYQRVRLVADAAGLGIWIWNFADNSLEWDNRMCEIYGVPEDQYPKGITYDLWRARIHPDDRFLAEPGQGEPTRLGSQWSGSYRIVLPDGAVRYLKTSAIMQYDRGGSPQGMIGINRDITDQVLYEQLLQDTNAVLEQRVVERTADLQNALTELQRASKLKDEFMSMISHELRTPLTGVLSMSEMLEGQIAGPLNARQVTYVRGITASGERLLHVINGILGYTHLLSGKVQLQVEPCDLAYLLDICAAAVGRRAAERQQTIAVQVTPPELTIMSDATAVAEVLKRLLDNAVKFTPAGGQIGLEAHPGVVPNTVDVVVWDTGIGIPANQHEHIFHAFTQADARLSRSHEGLGLGLAYVDEMVHLMGGTIAVASTPGAGSRFTITLPAPNEAALES